MLRKEKSILTLLIAFTGYIVGCILCYFLWYKNGQVLQFFIISLIIGTCLTFIIEYKIRNTIVKNANPYKTPIALLLIFVFIGGMGAVFHFGKTRVDDILNYEPTSQTIAVVVAIDLRSTRYGKQPWSIINYKVKNQIIEQSFADISTNLSVGKKYLIEYSLNYPDMFRILKEAH